MKCNLSSGSAIRRKITHLTSIKIFRTFDVNSLSPTLSFISMTLLKKHVHFIYIYIHIHITCISVCVCTYPFVGMHVPTFIHDSGMRASYMASKDSFNAGLITIVPSIANFKSHKHVYTFLITFCMRSISCLRIG